MAKWVLYCLSQNTTNDDDDGDVTDDADKVNHNDVDEEAESGKIALKETVSDLDYLKSMMVKKASEEEEKDTEEQTDEKTSNREEKKKEKKEKERKNETYYDVKLSNLPFKTKVKDVVIGCPCYFTDRERRALLDAAAVAGSYLKNSYVRGLKLQDRQL